VSTNGKPKPRLLVLNQYYWPGVEATAHLLTELCEALAADFHVTVVTGLLHNPPTDPGHFWRNGVEVIRVRSTAYERTRLSLRAVNYTTYLAQSVRAALAVERPDVVLTMTDPPIIGDVGLLVARRFGVPLVVISQDVFPEIAVELKRLENPLVIGMLRRLIHFYLRRADRVVAIGDTMRARLEKKGAHPEDVRVIPNWVDATKLTPQPRENAWAREHGLLDRFVVMHSGNVGHAQNLDALVRSTTFLRDLDDLRVMIVGGGARKAELEELAERLETDAVRFLPYQPRELLPLSLSSAHVHVVGLARGLSGFIVPSRVYGILAAGRPLIVAADQESETAQLVARVGCGVVVAPGRPELLAAALRRAYDGELDLEEMGRRGREYVESEADRRVAVSRYRALLAEVASRPA
jgi:glycosyltransferase involved in cell wall biosynthesis